MGTEPWVWLSLAGLGAFHGVNPAMGWLFAVALGLHRESRTLVFLALLPIALGHAASVALVASLAVAFNFVFDPWWIQVFAGCLLIGWAIYHSLARHRSRFGYQVGMFGLAAWSFLSATAHGAGLMLIPVLLPLPAQIGGQPTVGLGDSLASALLAVGIHTVAMLATTALIAGLIYEWVGVAVLRRGWINLGRLWTIGLVLTGLLLLILAFF